MNSLIKYKYLLEIDILNCTEKSKKILKRIAKNSVLLNSKYYCYVMDYLTVFLQKHHYYKLLDVEKILCHKILLKLDNYKDIIDRVFFNNSEMLSIFYEIIDEELFINSSSYNKIVTTASKFATKQSLFTFKKICKKYFQINDCKDNEKQAEKYSHMIKKFVWLDLTKTGNSVCFVNLMNNDKLLDLPYYKKMANKVSYINDSKIFELLQDFVSNNKEIDEFQFKRLIDIVLFNNGIENIKIINELSKKISRNHLNIILNLNYKDDKFTELIEQVLYIIKLLEDHVVTLDVGEVKEILFNKILNNDYRVALIVLNELTSQICNSLQHRVIIKNTQNLKKAIENELLAIEVEKQQFIKKMSIPKNRRF